ncbi:ABC-type uncharacterized transport system, periplasmic component [Hyphomicrobium sulfonivorans]|uniref:ABC-type uncharacterized transport system, periplasmic component n=1 Tax=Hyphomicrobium sulfonivorans TaxID=121290 RepID=A0A125NVR6_HYPSL|nr:DUF1007 family protein [Hyphomicrobium sulfonivorans]KWT70615.1 ABC-type uncharacterized transport system, periplasmic component [Hyphomicrobium sulfonivorans]
MRAVFSAMPAIVATVLAVTTAMFGTWDRAAAHPHVWVTMKETVLYENGAIAGLQQAWTFDELYTETAIEGLDKNGDGKYSREELQELAQVNIDGLKEFDYFISAKLGDANLTFKPPTDYWLEHTDDGILTLFFTLPLEKPVPADAKGFSFSVFDSSYFIAFNFAEADPIKLGAGAPSNCKPAISEAKPETDNDLQSLNDAFSSVMGDGGTVNIGSSRAVAIECAKS